MSKHEDAIEALERVKATLVNMRDGCQQVWIKGGISVSIKAVEDQIALVQSERQTRRQIAKILGEEPED